MATSITTDTAPAPAPAMSVDRLGRQRRSAFAPVFSGLYFDMKHKSGRIMELALENRRLLRNLSDAVQITSLMGARLSNNVANMATALQKLNEETNVNDPGVQQAGNRVIFEEISKYYHEQSALLARETSNSDMRFDQIADGEVELSAFGHSSTISFMRRPLLAFVAGCAFNFLTVLLCILVGVKYCRHKARTKHIHHTAPEKNVSINFNDLPMTPRLKPPMPPSDSCDIIDDRSLNLTTITNVDSPVMSARNSKKKRQTSISNSVSAFTVQGQSIPV